MSLIPIMERVTKQIQPVICRIAIRENKGQPGFELEETLPMSTYTTDVSWSLKDGEDFLAGRYSRGHTISFDGGASISASASPHVVGKWAVEAAIDPEEMLVAALSNCHMLSFLHVARLAGFIAASYRDRAQGVIETISPGKQAVTKVVLHPEITWKGSTPDPAKLALMHDEAHETCFIANSVKTEITIANLSHEGIWLKPSRMSVAEPG
jgi:organic hydroperoxide reductase OsmC/OhrA